MSGFLTMDLSVAILRDPKVRAAARAGGWPAVGAYIALLAASWEGGEQVDLEDALGALPRDYPELSPDELQALEAAGLTVDGSIPDGPWEGHYGKARSRSTAKAAGSARGGEATRRRWAEKATEQPMARPKARARPRPDQAQTDRLTDAPSGASVGQSPDEPADPDGPARRTPPSGKVPKLVQDENGWRPTDIDLGDDEDPWHPSGATPSPARAGVDDDGKLRPPPGYVDPVAGESFADKMARHGLTTPLGRDRPA